MIFSVTVSIVMFGPFSHTAIGIFMVSTTRWRTTPWLCFPDFSQIDRALANAQQVRCILNRKAGTRTAAACITGSNCDDYGKSISPHDTLSYRLPLPTSMQYKAAPFPEQNQTLPSVTTSTQCNPQVPVAVQQLKWPHKSSCKKFAN
jgi:hypothetical protein